MSAVDTLAVSRIALALMERSAARGTANPVIVVTSVAAGEGKTVVARLLAREFARSGADVSLVSTAEMNRRTAERESLTRNVARLLADDAAGSDLPVEAHAARGRPHKVVLGPDVSDGSFFDVEDTSTALRALQQRFRYSIVDAPDLARCGALVTQSDATVLVIDSERTTPGAIRDAMTLAGVEPAQFAGAILNRSGRWALRARPF